MAEVGADQAAPGAGGERAAVAEVLRFWFEEIPPKAWFEKDLAFDRRLGERFGALHARLAAGVPEAWLGDAEGCLAALLVLDQFSRNLHRGTPGAFAQDAAALAIAERALAAGYDQAVPEAWRMFFYLPFEHSEDLADQARSVALFAPLGEDLLGYARAHQVIIERFGRFPHRNAILGRPSTEAELAFLEEPNSSF